MTMENVDTPSPAAHSIGDTPRGRPFGPGMSGNPNGRPRGSRNKTTTALEVLLDGEAEVLTRKAVDKALAGDPIALRLCLERILPPRRDRPVEFDLPHIATAADAVKASSAILAACAAGDLSPSEAAVIMGLTKTHVQTLETAEIEARVTALERRQLE
jgi:hypothetical protein